MAELIEVGRVGRPHGLDGSFFVEQASEDPDRFRLGSTLYVGEEPAEVVASKRSGGRPVLLLDRAAARGAALAVGREQLGEPAEGSYYVSDLVGLEVVEESGARLGRVSAVDPAPANDVLELDTGLLLPFAETCVVAVEPEAGRIVVAPGFAEPE